MHDAQGVRGSSPLRPTILSSTTYALNMRSSGLSGAQVRELVQQPMRRVSGLGALGSLTDGASVPAANWGTLSPGRTRPIYCPPSIGGRALCRRPGGTSSLRRGIKSQRPELILSVSRQRNWLFREIGVIRGPTCLRQPSACPRAGRRASVPTPWTEALSRIGLSLIACALRSHPAYGDRRMA